MTQFLEGPTPFNEGGGGSSYVGIILKTNHLYNTGLLEDITTFYSRTDIFQYSFFPCTILEWKKVDRRIQQATTMLSFKNVLLKIG